jgi:hypothetical protein
MTSTPSEPSASSVEAFFTTLRVQTADPVHLRLITAARRTDPGASMESELNKIIIELLDEA